MIHNNYRNVGNSCTIYIALLAIAFLIMIVSLLHVFVFIGAFKKKILLVLSLVLILKQRFIEHINETYLKIALSF